jgi:syntaxin-binding protein 5
MNGMPVLLALAGNGHVQAYALPSLKQLHSSPLFASKTEMRCVRATRSPHAHVYYSFVHTFCMGRQAHGVYQCTPSELQKFTINAELASTLSDVLGVGLSCMRITHARYHVQVLFQGVDMPEPPRQSVATTLISIFAKPTPLLDREELCE